MKKIKFLKNNFAMIDGRLYRGYMVSFLPNNFGCIYNTEDETDGISSFIKFKGLTYILNK